MIQPIFRQLPAERVPMNPQHVRSARLISVNSIQHALDKPLFEFADGFVEKYSAFHHLAD
jgi:hypothetical protein